MSAISRTDLDRRMAAVAAFRAGATLSDIAHIVGESTYEVEKWLTALGVLRRCESCGCILEAEEAGQCATCLRRTNGERHVYCRTPMPAPEPEPVNLQEVFRYA